MSDPVLDALAVRAGGSRPPPTSGDPVMDALTARASGKTPKSESQPHEFRFDPSMLDDPEVSSGMGAAEAGLHAASATAGQAVGGVSGIGTLLSGGSADDAEKNTDWWKQSLTYQPRTAAGEGAVDTGARTLGLAAAPLQAVKDFAGDNALEATGSPSFATGMSMAPDVLLSLVGAPGVPKGAGSALASDARAASGALKGVSLKESPLAETNPFAHESLGAAAVAPELKAASPELRAEVARATAAGEKLDRVAFDRRLEAESLPIPMKLTKGQASQDVEQISHEMNRRGGDPELAQRFAEHNQQLIDNLDEIRAGAAPNAVGNDHIQNGQALIDSYKNYDAEVTADIGAKYKALRDANGGDFPVDGPAFVQAADAALKKSMKARYVPAQVSADLEEFRAGKMTFENFENMRTNLAAEARKAERSGDGNAAAAVRIVRDSLEELPISGESAKLKPIADAARKAAKARFDRLKADPAYRAAVDDSVAAGESSPLADDFVQKFVVKGKAANIQNMRETLAADPTASETITAGALNYMKSKSGVNLYTNEGNFSQAGFNRALSELTPKLGQLLDPKVSEQVQTLGNVARYTQAQPRGSFVNNSNTTVAAHAASLAKGAAERGVNALLPGAELGTLAREKLAKRADKKFVREALDPASGITKEKK